MDGKQHGDSVIGLSASVESKRAMGRIHGRHASHVSTACSMWSVLMLVIVRPGAEGSVEPHGIQ